MENIYDIASLVHKHKSTLYALIPENDSSPLRRLAMIAFSDKTLNDEECMVEIYGKRDSKAFPSLKSRLFDKLNSLLIIHEDILLKKDEALIQKNENLKKIIAGNLLITSGKIDLGLHMLEKAVEVAMKKNFTENVIQALKKLIIEFGSTRYNKFKFKKYLDLQEKYIYIYNWEVKAQNYYLILRKNNINSLVLPSKELISKASEYVQELNNVKGVTTPLFAYDTYRIKAIYYEFIKDYNQLIIASKQAIKDIKIPEYELPFAFSNINIRTIFALIQTADYEKAIQFGKKHEMKTIKDSNSWFRLKYYLAKAYFYNKKYSGAIQIIVSMNNEKYLKMFPKYNELIRTIFGYIHLLVFSNYIEISTEIKNKLPEFKLGKYLNSMPIYSRDKRGFNLSILFLQVAFLLQRKDHDAIIDRADSLKQYAYRYLRRDDSFRSNCMIKMVIQMVKANFHPVRTERYTADLLKQLKSVKLAGSGQNIEIEVLPFEVLWDIMLKSLKDK